MALTLVVLAAGMGSRYGGLKQIDPVGEHGELIIDYSIYDALRAGFDRCVFVIRPEIEQAFRAVIGQRLEKRIECVYVHQQLTTALPPGKRLPPDRVKPLGTAHAVLACADAVDEPFAVINADDFYGAGAFRGLCDFLAEQPSEGLNYAMIAYRLRNTLSEHGSVARGICSVSEDGWLRNVVEHTAITPSPRGIYSRNHDGRRHALDGDSLASMNCWGFTPSLFEYLARQFPDFLAMLPQQPAAEFFLPTVVNELLQRNACRVRVVPTDAQWFGVTYPEDKESARASVRKMTARGDYPVPLWG